MMHWRNKRAVHAGPTEPYLGDVIGTILPPMTPIRRVHHRHPRWIEDGTAAILAIIMSSVVAMLTALALWAVFTTIGVKPSLGRDIDGRFAQSDLKPWFDSLRSSKGLCCSITDGFSIADVDWTVEAGRYRVRLDGQWIDVPDDALVTVPNRYGPPMVWPLKDANGATTIRCFMPGTLA